MRRLLTEALPWTTFLPEADLDQLLSELVAVTQGAASLANLSPVAVLLAQWRHTAEVYADPVLEIVRGGAASSPPSWASRPSTS